jgi:2-polyprenyl-3-methyl-5-hydroxy-6-metoxy-1,4-benzoquinol methylase
MSYFDSYKNLDFEPTISKFRKLLLKDLIQTNSISSVLEVGCGSNSIFENLENIGIKKATIVEPNVEFISKYDANQPIKNCDFEIINSTLEEAVSSISRGDFQLIIVSCLLHEISNREFFLENVHKIADKNTLIHISVPNKYSFHRLLALSMGLIKEINERSKNQKLFNQHEVMSIDDLKNFISCNNFEINDCGSYFIKPFNNKQMAEIINNKIFPGNLPDGLFKLSSYFPNHGAEIYVNCKSKVILK